MSEQVDLRLGGNRGRARVSRIAQFSGVLTDADPIKAAAEAREKSLAWLRWKTKEFAHLPKEAFPQWEGEYTAPGHHSEAVYLQEEDWDFWAAKLDHPDPEYAARSWMVEVVVAGTAKGVAHFGLRLSHFDTKRLPVPSPSTPRLLRDIAENGELSDAGMAFSSKAYVVGRDLEFGPFSELLFSKTRLAPVYVLSTEGESSSATPIDANRLASKCFGLAHVIVLPSSESYRLTSLVGRENSVFNGAVRTYLPGLLSDGDYPGRHRLATARTARDPSWTQDGAPGSFTDLLVAYAYEASVNAGNSQKLVPPFVEVKRRVNERRAEKAGRANADPESQAVISDLKAELEEMREEIETVGELAAEAQANANRESKSYYWLKEDNARLRAQVSDAGIPQPENYPETVAAIADWVDRNLTGRLELHPRAQRALKGSAYENPELVCRALDLLANQYLGMKNADTETGNLREDFQKSLESLNLECSPSIAKDRAGAHGDEYFVIHRGRKCLLENHIKKGTSREPRKCLRIYFFWDAEEQVVVVGSLPGHLDTQAT